MDKSVEICESHLEGKCRKGGRCKFYHFEGKQTNFKNVCRLYARNACKMGNDCKFYHPEKNEIVCKFFASGKCKYSDDECKTATTNANSTTREKSRKRKKRKEREKLDIVTAVRF
jgi:hypothetical protein